MQKSRVKVMKVNVWHSAVFEALAAWTGYHDLI